jgi:hypothetical protein
MIRSSRVDRVRSRHLGRIRTRKQSQCHQPISLFWMLQQRRDRTGCALFALTVWTFPRNANVVERATGAAVIPPTMVKIMTLECHAPLEVNAIPSSTAHVNSPQHHVFLQGRAFLLIRQEECFTQPRYAVGRNSMNTCVSISQQSDSVALRCALVMARLRRCAGLWARERQNLLLTISATDLSGTGIRTNDCIQHRSWHPAF